MENVTSQVEMEDETSQAVMENLKGQAEMMENLKGQAEIVMVACGGLPASLIFRNASYLGSCKS